MKERGSSDREIAEFNRSLQATVETYLREFPDEVERLSRLTELLRRTDIDLRQRSTIPEGHICASGVIVSPDYQKVLMLLHKSLGIWVVPGGHYDLTDNVPANTALREAEEETGYARLSLHDWHRATQIPIDIDTHDIPANPHRNEDAHVHYDFRYIVSLDDSQQVNLDSSESLSYQWVSLGDVDPQSSIAPAIAKLPLMKRFELGR